MKSDGIRVALGYEAGLSSASGISRYARELYHGLSRHPDIAEVRRFANFQWLSNGPGDETDSTATAAPQPQTISARRRLVQVLRPLIPAAEPLLRVVRDLKATHVLRPGVADIYHEPNFALRLTSLPTVVSVHDLSIFLYPEYHPVVRVRHLTREIPRALQRADRVITLSHLVKAQIIDMFGTPAGKIAVIPIGLNPIFRPVDETACAVTMARLGLGWKNFTLFVGTLEPRKNLERVLKSLRLLPPELVRRTPLAVAGGTGWRDDALKAELDAAVRDGLAVPVGQVSDEALTHLYAATRGVVFVSHYEGQGLPAIEAAACGTPLLISDGSAMHEQIGSLALSCSAHDTGAIAAGIRALIEDDTLQSRALASASQMHERCSMQTCVDATVRVYQDVLASHR